MADATFKARCQLLRKRGCTLNEIVSATQRSKTTVYFHIKNIPLSRKRRREINRANSLRVIEFSRGRKGKSSRAFRQFHAWNKHMVSLLAHLLFDGEITYNGCIYNNRSISLINNVELAFTIIYDYPPIYWVNKDNVLRISYNNVALAAYIREKAQQLLNEIESLPIELQQVFLKAFFDDEGCISFEPKRGKRAVRGYQHNKTTLHIVRNLLKIFGIASKIQGSVEIVITGRNNIKRFAQEINFSPGVCVNGNRSNSTWKQSLEKREILRRALASYQTTN